MKNRFRLFRRGWGKYYLEDTDTGKQQSLRTTDKREAQRLVHARKEALHNPQVNLMIVKGPAAERRPAIVHPESDPGAFVAVDAVAGDGEITSGRSCIEREGQRPCLAHLLEEAEPQESEFRSQVKWRLGAGGSQKRILATTCRRA